MKRTLWAHQDLSRKRVKKYAARVADKSIRDDIASRGMEAVFVGTDLETGQLFWILDNTVFNRYEIMITLHEDMVQEHALRKYIFEHGYRRFDEMLGLEQYVEQLNRETYDHS